MVAPWLNKPAECSSSGTTDVQQPANRTSVVDNADPVKILQQQVAKSKSVSSSGNVEQYQLKRNSKADLNRRDARQKAGEFFNEQCDFLEKNMIVQGADFPPLSSVLSENSTRLDARLIKNIEKVLGFDRLNPLQTNGISILLNRKNLLVQAPTGSGKTATFLLPAIQLCMDFKKQSSSSSNHPLVIIMSNTQQLAAQSYKIASDLVGEDGKYQAQNLGVTVGPLYGQSAMTTQEASKKDIIVATYGRLQSAVEGKHVSLDRLQCLILDEADEMTDENRFGYDIFKLYDEFPENVKNNLLVGMFSATYEINEAQSIVLNDLQEKLFRIGTEEPASILVRGKLGLHHFDAIKIDLLRVKDICQVEFFQKFWILKNILDRDSKCKEKDENGRFKECIAIFTKTRKRVITLCSMLCSAGYDFQAYCGSFTSAYEDNVIRKLNERSAMGVVCTNKLARGQDIPSLAHIILFDIDQDFKWNEHRVGRTARAGRTGRATFFVEISNIYSEVPSRVYDFFKEQEHPVPEWLEEYMPDQVQYRADEEPVVESYLEEDSQSDVVNESIPRDWIENETPEVLSNRVVDSSTESSLNISDDQSFEARVVSSESFMSAAEELEV